MTNNPDVTAADIITDVEARLGTPNISSTIYLPWISYSYQRTYQALIKCGQEIKERLFGNSITLTLAAGTAEYNLKTYIPRFGGIMKVETKYGASGDDWEKARKLPSLANWDNQNNVSTTYRSKTEPLYYVLDNTIGFIPTPPSTDTGTPYAKVWYIRRPYRIDLTTDIIDIPYRFLWPLVDYVHAKAIEKTNEDYSTAAAIESKFAQELETMALAAVSEDDENDGTNAVQLGSDSSLYDNPLA